MPALASCSSPSSFQLRWGLRCRKSPPVSQSIRIGALNRSSGIKIVRADAGNVDAEGGSEGSASQSPNSDASQLEKFAGWFGEDYEGGSSEGENRFGGIAGAALAGIFLAGGLAFASLSLTSRRQNGFKPDMQALTTEQELLLTSESEDNKILVEERSTEETTKSTGTGSTTGINEDYSTLESIESTSHSRVDITPEVTSSGREHELVCDVEASHDNDTLINEDSDMSSTISGPNYIKNELPIPEPDVASSFTDSHFQMPCENIDSAVEDNNIISREEEKSESRGDYSSKLYGEPLGSEKSVLPQPNLTLETQHNHECIGLDFNPMEQDIGAGEGIQTLIDGSVTSSLEGDTSQGYPSGTVDVSSSVPDDKYEILNDTVIFAPEGSSVNESGSPLTPYLSVFAGHYINELGFHPQDFINRSLTSPSVLPETCFSHAGIPAPSALSPALQVQPGKVLIPALVDQAHVQALAALQALKVIEADVQPGDLCTRREYARWLVSASSILSRSTTSKVYPAMYIENVSELAFDDITPDDPDFPYIQGLAEAGLISSRLSQLDMNSSKEELASVYFAAESPLSRQDLVSWKMALEKTVLPEVDRKAFRERSGYVDIGKINPDAWPAIAADLSSGENGIISLAFGFTLLFQPNKPVSKAQAAVALSTGAAAEIVGEELARIEAESLAETAVLEHAELVAEVEKDLNASFERELAMEREKIEAMEKLIREARLELEKLRSEREGENNALIKERASVESEMEILSRLRNDAELQLENLLSNKMEIAFERDRINKLHEEAERENLAIARLQYELEVERKALTMARAWAEDEAKRAREQAKILEEARGRWQKHGIKVVVDEELRESATAGVTWQTAVEKVTVEEEMDTEAETAEQKFRSRYQRLAKGVKARADQLVSQLKELLAKVKGTSAAVIESLIQKITAIISALKHRVSEAKTHAVETKQHATHQFTEVKDNVVSKTTTSMHKFTDNASEFGSSVRDGTRRAAEDFRESVEKITQRFKM